MCDNTHAFLLCPYQLISLQSDMIQWTRKLTRCSSYARFQNAIGLFLARVESAQSRMRQHICTFRSRFDLWDILPQVWVDALSQFVSRLVPIRGIRRILHICVEKKYLGLRPRVQFRLWVRVRLRLQHWLRLRIYGEEIVPTRSWAKLGHRIDTWIRVKSMLQEGSIVLVLHIQEWKPRHY